MRRKRYRARLDLTLIALMTLFVLGGMAALGFLQNLSTENRALIIVVSSLGILVCFAGFLYLDSFRKWFRKFIWLKSMSAWLESVRARSTAKFAVTVDLSTEELKYLAIHAYSRMGYRVAIRDTGAGSLLLVDPRGRFELVACVQQPDPIQLNRVYSLYLEMSRSKAVRAFFWAPKGFTEEAISWVAHRPIVLADRYEIGRLVDCAHAKGSWFLE